jgi:transposase InsO family protein
VIFPDWQAPEFEPPAGAKVSDMEWYNKILAVTFRELTEPNPEAAEDAAGLSVLSTANYKKLARLNKINVLRPGKGLDHTALVEYESLPERFKDRFKHVWGDPYKLIKESMMKDEVITVRRARDFFAEHLLPDGTHIPDEFQREYTQNASVLNVLISMMKNMQTMRKMLNNRTPIDFSSIHETSERLRLNPGHTLPPGEARLRVKINEYKKKHDGRYNYECLVSGKLGNTNTVKITAEGGMFLVMQKRRRVPVMSDKQIMLEFNRVAQNYGWKQLRSVESVTNFLNAPENMQRWYDAVYGELKAFRKFGYKFKTILPDKRDALWYGDGTKLNLYYRAYEGGRWVMKTTQVYEVMDAFSETLLGYHISDSENYTAQYNAYRMAVETAQARPFEIVVDNQGGHKKLDNSGFLKRICRMQRNTAPYRPPSKTIEHVFGRFQQEVLHEDWRFTGQNITAKSDKSRQNLEFIEANAENLYTLDELKAAYAYAREEWNSRPHPATGIPREEMYHQSTNPEAQGLDKLDMIEAFWLITRKTSTYTASGIEVTIDGKKYTYDVYGLGGLPDFDFRKKNIGRKFYIQYDPNDLTQVRLYEETASGKRYVANAQPYYEVMRGLQDATYESSSFVRRVMNLEEQIRIDTYLDNIKLEHDHGVAPEQFGLNRPRPKGISRRKLGVLEETSSPNRLRNRELETVDVDQLQKEISNLTYDEVDMYDKL